MFSEPPSKRRLTLARLAEPSLPPLVRPVPTCSFHTVTPQCYVARIAMFFSFVKWYLTHNHTHYKNDISVKTSSQLILDSINNVNN